jgi:hypothetical protein
MCFHCHSNQYLIWDAETIPLKRIELFNENRTLIQTSSEYGYSEESTLGISERWCHLLRLITRTYVSLVFKVSDFFSSSKIFLGYGKISIKQEKLSNGK